MAARALIARRVAYVVRASCLKEAFSKLIDSRVFKFKNEASKQPEIVSMRTTTPEHAVSEL